MWALLFICCIGRLASAALQIELHRFELWPDKDQQVFTSVGYPETAPPNTKQKWIINGVPGSIIQINCKEISLLGLCKDNNITRIDGRSAGLICGDNHDDYTFTSIESSLELTLTNGPRGGNKVSCTATSKLKWADSIPDYLLQPPVQVDSSEFGIAEKSPTTCPCGWANKKPKSRIIGGEETEVNEYPLMASLVEIVNKTEKGVVTKRFCGGAIVSPWHILTAAHCTIDYTQPGARRIAVVIGDHDHTKWDETDANKMILVSNIVVHEKYNDKKTKYDISLLTLNEEIKYTDKVGPACLPTNVREDSESWMVGEPLKGLGWGLVGYPGKSSKVLLQAWFKVIPLEVCAKYFIGSVDMVYEHQLCIYAKNKDLCMGDSGGPLLWLNPDTNRFTLVGLVSFGKSCSNFYPSVVTDVSYFLPWIQNQIQKNSPSYNMQCCTKKVNPKGDSILS